MVILAKNMILGSKLVQENGVKSRCKDKYLDL